MCVFQYVKDFQAWWVLHFPIFSVSARIRNTYSAVTKLAMVTDYGVQIHLHKNGIKTIYYIKWSVLLIFSPLIEIDILTCAINIIVYDNRTCDDYRWLRILI